MNIKVIQAAIEVYEIEHHMHNITGWYGDGGGGTLAENLTPITLTAGAGDAFSAGEQISDGTELGGGKSTRLFDLRGILVTAVSVASNIYVLQFLHGTGVIGDAEILTNYIGFFPATGRSGPIHEICKRAPCNHKIWVKTKCETDAATINIMIGPHIYSYLT